MSVPHSEVEMAKFAGQVQVRILSVLAQLVGAAQTPISCACCGATGRLAGSVLAGAATEADANAIAVDIDPKRDICISGCPLPLKI